MSALAAGLADYLRLRRSLGYKLERAGQVLASFVACAGAAGAEHVTTDLAISWALLAPNPDSCWRAARLSAVRGFARYLHAIDPAHEIPPAGVISRGPGRPAPYLYSEGEVTALMTAARRLRPPLRAATLETVIGLLAVSGLRAAEVIRLDNDDVGFGDAALTVRASKGGKSRIVPLDQTTMEALRSYAAVRDRCFPQPLSGSFFVCAAGRRLRGGNLRYAFATVAGLAGLRAPGSARGPRLADFRHSFAVQTLTGWYKAGLDTGPRLPMLSAYLGHVSPASTYWYLSASPGLLAAAAGRLPRPTTRRPA